MATLVRIITASAASTVLFLAGQALFGAGPFLFPGSF